MMGKLKFCLACALATILAGCGSGGVGSSPPQSFEITAALSPISLKFDSTVIQTTSAAQSLTLTNNSAASLGISSITASGPFTQMNNCFGSLAASASCTINVVFSPTTMGTANGSITVADNANNTPQTAALSGTGTSGFVATGTMTTSRSNHTATLLENGSVLIAAGSNSTSFDGTNTAELYDPTSGTFTPTGNLLVSFFGATATLLDNGKVLIAGGTQGVSIANAEIYDPATKTFTATGNLNAARAFHTATLLGNGKVLIAGGFGNFGIEAGAELYDPTTGNFTSTGSMTAARYSHAATLLNDGMVLITGGETSGTGTSPSLASAELYDPAAGTFTATGSMSTARASHTATLLNNGEVLIVGGASNQIVSNTLSTTYYSTAELYDPTAASFTLTGNMSIPRAGHTATLLNSGMVLVAGGGSSNTSGPLNSAEVYDSDLGTFSATASMTTARGGHTATRLTNGNILIAGGVGASASTSELYLPGSAAPAGLVSIAIAPSGTMLPSGGTQQFIATGTFSDNSTEVLQSVIWSSSNLAVAEISNDASNRGVALALTAGMSTITATAGSTKGSAVLTAP